MLNCDIIALCRWGQDLVAARKTPPTAEQQLVLNLPISSLLKCTERNSHRQKAHLGCRQYIWHKYILSYPSTSTHVMCPIIVGS